MTGSDALSVAVAIYREPAQAADWRRLPLPQDIELLLRVACGEQEALALARSRMAMTESDLSEAAVFGLQQLLFSGSGDAYRVLGTAPDASHAQLRRHYRWLMKWLHPDRHGDGWESIYADRVNLAWQALKTPERRARHDAEAGFADSLGSDSLESDPAKAGGPDRARDRLGENRVEAGLALIRERARHRPPTPPKSASAAPTHGRRSRMLLSLLGVAGLSVVGLVYLLQPQAPAVIRPAWDSEAVLAQAPRSQAVARPVSLAADAPTEPEAGAETAVVETAARNESAETEVPGDGPTAIASTASRQDFSEPASSLPSDRTALASGSPPGSDSAASTAQLAPPPSEPALAQLDQVPAGDRLAAATATPAPTSVESSATGLEPPGSSSAPVAGSPPASVTARSDSATPPNSPVAVARQAAAPSDVDRSAAHNVRDNTAPSSSMAAGSVTPEPERAQALAARQSKAGARDASTAPKVQAQAAEALVAAFASAYSSGNARQFDSLIANELSGGALGQMRERLSRASMRYLEVGDMEWREDEASLHAMAPVRDTYVRTGERKAVTQEGLMRWEFRIEDGVAKIAAVEFSGR